MYIRKVDVLISQMNIGYYRWFLNLYPFKTITDCFLKLNDYVDKSVRSKDSIFIENSTNIDCSLRE